MTRHNMTRHDMTRHNMTRHPTRFEPSIPELDGVLDLAGGTCQALDVGEPGAGGGGGRGTGG